MRRTAYLCKRPARGKTLVLHIGDHKTGSTTLQDMFATGQLTLADGKLLYPGYLNHNYLLGQFRAELRRFSSLRRSLVARPDRAKYALHSLPKGNAQRPNLPKLRSMIAETEAEFIVLSGEEFENIAPINTKVVLDHWFSDLVDDYRVIAYVRPHAARLVSNFAELVKLGEFRGDMADYLAKLLASERFHFAQRFLRWRNIFGDQFILRPMIRSELANHSVVDDFMQIAFEGRAHHIGQMPLANESLGLTDLAALKFIQERFDLEQTDKFYRHTMARELVRHLGLFEVGGEKNSKLKLHKSLAEDLALHYREDARSLDAEFFGSRGLMEAELDKAIENAPEAAQSLAPEQHFSDATLRRLAALREMLWHILQTDNRWARFFHENRVRALHKTRPVSDTAGVGLTQSKAD